MTDRLEIAAEARRWLGTPYLHQASLPGAGSDCLGLVRGIWRGLHGAEPQDIPPYTQDWSEPQRDEILWRSCQRWLIEQPPEGEHVGDVLLFRMARHAVSKHLGIQVSVGDSPTFIHAYCKHGVVETRLTQPWRIRVVARFSFP